MRRRALTLLELLVTLVIIAILMAILVPAVQAAREVTRRMQCSNRMKQFSLGLHQYADVHGVLPVFSFKNYPFHVWVLPFVEQEALYNRFDFRVNAMDYAGPLDSVQVPIFECPSDNSRYPIGHIDYARSNYHGNSGSGAQAYGFNGVFGYGEHPLGSLYWLPLASISDGLSNTAMLAEVVARDGSAQPRRVYWELTGSSKAEDFNAFVDQCRSAPGLANPWAFPEGWPWTKSSGFASTSLYNHVLPPNSSSCMAGTIAQHSVLTSSSFHSATVNVALVDGSVHGYSNSVDLSIWRQLGSRAGNP